VHGSTKNSARRYKPGKNSLSDAQLEAIAQAGFERWIYHNLLQIRIELEDLREIERRDRWKT
jgi:hypothetical protein